MKLINLTVALALPLALLASTGASAREVRNYDYIMGRFREVAITSSVPKVTSKPAVNNNKVIGIASKPDDHSAQTAVYVGSKRVSKWKGIGQGDRIVMHFDGGNSKYQGQYIGLGMRSDKFNRVKIRAIGSWSPDDK